jgi:hypothetical protein
VIVETTATAIGAGGTAATVVGAMAIDVTIAAIDPDVFAGAGAEAEAVAAATGRAPAPCRQRRTRETAAIRSAAMLLFAFAASAGSVPASARGSGVNKDAMTMQDCKDRLALPVNKRAKSEDPQINLDAICANMLSARRSANKAPASVPSPASAPRR